MHGLPARHGQARRAVVATAAAVFALLAGCSTGAEPSPGPGEQDGPIQVGAIMYARDLEFWQLVEAGMRDASRAFTLAAIVGSMLAGRVATRLPADRLRRWFAYLVLAVAAFVTVQTLLNPAAVTG